ncbi:hypothetical protein [Streptomyces marokkonensis]|uniref:hypothetical protein n=1 Tax=Streptomyces marokkonensis TaxID=324855 RepID=UPI0011F36D83|nr:hypothetical protein [Streptomyces marokkonensis]
MSAKTVTPVFKYAFLGILAVTMPALAVYILLVVLQDHPSEGTKDVLELCNWIVKSGFGALLGLIGGKAA